MTATALEAPPQPRVYTHRQILVVMSGLMLGVLLAALDQTIVSTALTRISQDFKRPDLYSWVVTSYLLTSTASTPLYGKISDLYGRKKIFQFAIVLFLIGSALCGLSQNMVQLILFRGVQGLGAGGLISLALAIVGDVIPPRERGRYQGYFGAVFGASSVLGPLIGGFLVDQASWRYVFYVNIPVGIVALVVVQRVLQLDHTKREAKVDVVGALLLVAGVSLFLVAVQNAGRDAALSTTDAVIGGAGLLLVALFIGWETRAAEPILPLRLFANSVFAVSAALSLITGAVMFGAIIFLPQYMQLVRGISPTKSGLHLLPLLAGLLLTSIGSGRLISKIGRYKIFVVVGTAILAIGLGLLTTIRTDSSFWTISAIIFVVGVGLGLFMQTLVLATQNAVERRDLGVGTSAVTFFRTLGGALGASVLGAVLLASQRNSLPADIARYGPRHGPLEAFTHGMSQAYLWAVPIAVLAFVISFFLRDLRLSTGPTGVPQAPEGSDAAPAAGASGPDAVSTPAGQAAVAPPAQAAVATSGHAAVASPDRPAGERAPGQDAAVGTVGGAEQVVGYATGVGRNGSSEAARPGSGWREARSVTQSAPMPNGIGPGDRRPTVAGTVRRPDGLPLSGAILTLTDLGGGQLTRVRSGDSGEYRLVPPTPGSFLIVCTGSSYEPVAAVVTVADSPVRHDVVVQVASSLSGSVRQAGPGVGLVGAVLTLTDARGQVVASTVTGEAGRYLLADLIAGSYTLTATADRHQAASTSVTVGVGEDVASDIELVGGGDLVGRVVVARSGQPLPGAAVAVLDADGAVVDRGLTDAAGRYRFVDLPPGSYTVTASGYAPVAARALVASGQTGSTELGMGPEHTHNGEAEDGLHIGDASGDDDWNGAVGSVRTDRL